MKERKKESQINFVNSWFEERKKNFTPRLGMNLIKRGKLSPFLLLWSKSRNESLSLFFFFFFFFSFLAISVEELSGWHFSNLMFIRIPDAPPILIFLLSPSPYAFSISQRSSPDPGVFSRCVPLYFTNPRFLFVSYPTGGAPLSYIPVTNPSPSSLYFYYSCTPRFRLRYSSRFLIKLPFPWFSSKECNPVWIVHVAIYRQFGIMNKHRWTKRKYERVRK